MSLGPEVDCSAKGKVGSRVGAATFEVSSNSQSVKLDSEDVYKGVSQRMQETCATAVCTIFGPDDYGISTEIDSK